MSTTLQVILFFGEIFVLKVLGRDEDNLYSEKPVRAGWASVVCIGFYQLFCHQDYCDI